MKYEDDPEVPGSSYLPLAGMAAVSFVAVYVLLYAVVDSPGDAYANLNQAYLAALVIAPMILIELLFMGAMYPNRTLNTVLLATCVAGLVVAGLAIRGQAAIGDRQLLRSMIPHHSAAVLMCRQAAVTDAEVRDLCAAIVANHQRDIERMKALLERPAAAK